jgi:hypothetical protein
MAASSKAVGTHGETSCKLLPWRVGFCQFTCIHCVTSRGPGANGTSWGTGQTFTGFSPGRCRFSPGFGDAWQPCTRRRTLDHRTAPPNNVSIIPGRHSRMLLAGNQKKNLDARFRGHDAWISTTYSCEAVLSVDGRELIMQPGSTRKKAKTSRRLSHTPKFSA